MGWDAAGGATFQPFLPSMPSEASCDKRFSTARTAYTPTRKQVVGVLFAVDGAPDAKTTMECRGIYYLFLFVVIELGNIWIGPSKTALQRCGGRMPHLERLEPDPSGRS